MIDNYGYNFILNISKGLFLHENSFVFDQFIVENKSRLKFLLDEFSTKFTDTRIKFAVKIDLLHILKMGSFLFFYTLDYNTSMMA